MNKNICKHILLGILMSLSLTTMSVFANEEDSIDINILQNENYEVIETFNPDLPMDEQYEIVKKNNSRRKKRAAHTSFFKEQEDYIPFAKDGLGLSKINSQCIATGDTASDIFFRTFEGYGLTKWNGDDPINSVSSKVTVTSHGVYPKISISGSDWSLLKGTAQVANKKSSTNTAKAYYENVKIQNASTFTAYFTVHSVIDLKGESSYDVSEDVWWWF